MRLLEFEHINEAFTPQVEGWYDRDDIRLWFQKLIDNNHLFTHRGNIHNINTWTSEMMQKYKATDIDMMNDWLDNYFPFRMIDLDFNRGKAIWKVEPIRAMDRE